MFSSRDAMKASVFEGVNETNHNAAQREIL